jgi:hypothetical protein
MPNKAAPSRSPHPQAAEARRPIVKNRATPLRTASPAERKRPWGLLLSIGMLVSVFGLWIAVNRVTWLGPMVADGLRLIIGKDAVAKLEDIGYAIQDRFYQYTRKGEPPKAYWSVPEVSKSPAPSVDPMADPAANSAPMGLATAADTAQAAAPDVLPSVPKEVGPVHKSWSAPGDGQWVAIAVPDVPSAPPTLFKTLLHPDKNRSWAEVFVVAMDARTIELHMLAGTKEPIATEPEAEGMVRPGVIPKEHHDLVLAAFNGGFKTEHGKYGMRVNGITLIAPRTDVCALALYSDSSIRIGSWSKLAPQEKDMVFWRQTPACMYEEGVLHPNLRAGAEKKWGSTLDGETVIRRSAIGVSADGSFLYMAISNNTTATAIADGLHHAGAAAVAQLDVNFSYPKFVLFEKGSASERQATALADGFEFSTDEFIRQPSRRDFFYVTQKTKR